MDALTLSLIGIIALLGVAGTLGTYWKLSQRIREMERKLGELKRELSATRVLEDKVKLLEDIIREHVLGKQDNIKPRLKSKQSDRRVNGFDEEYLDLKIYVLYKQGKSIREIARELGLSKSTVHRRLKKIVEKKKPVIQHPLSS